jgi:hypothetical protein
LRGRELELLLQAVKVVSFPQSNVGLALGSRPSRGILEALSAKLRRPGHGEGMAATTPLGGTRVFLGVTAVLLVGASDCHGRDVRTTTKFISGGGGRRVAKGCASCRGHLARNASVPYRGPCLLLLSSDAEISRDGRFWALVDQVNCLVRADIDIGHICRLTVSVFPAQIHVTILALRYLSPRPLAGFQRA